MLADWLLIVGVAAAITAAFLLIDLAVDELAWRFERRRSARGRSLDLTSPAGRTRLGIDHERRGPAARNGRTS